MDTGLQAIGFDPVEIAVIDKQQDLRCVSLLSEAARNAKSTDAADARLAATQEAVDKSFQRNKVGSSTWQIFLFGVKTRVGLDSDYTFTMTFADGGTEDVVIKSIPASQDVASKGNLRVGSGRVEPQSCAKG